MTDYEKFIEMLDGSEFTGGYTEKDSKIEYEGEMIDVIEICLLDDRDNNVRTLAFFLMSDESFICFMNEKRCI